ncbi:MAG TPA: serine/threonine-protein kinase [Baekduia sp.]|jgi:serine/threonine-protein kinase
MPAVHQVSLPPRYRLVGHIANGGMAAVWAAQDAVLERLVAVKTLAAGYAADPAARRRFTREARAAARVSDHPNVVTVFDIGDHEDQAFIVMEHFSGGTVADRLKRSEPVPVATALRWLRQTASALDAAHAADIVHRDVKPGNLLLDETGRLAVGDFGIASIAGETQVTAAGQVLGTAAYLSPEQARGGVATPASDRYSLAVVAYELLCGHKPFEGETAIEQARARLQGDPPAPTGPCVVAAAALQHGLAQDPAARPLTAGAFVDELESVLGRRGGDPTLETAAAPSRRFVRDQPRTPAIVPPEVAPPVVARTPVARADDRWAPEPEAGGRWGATPPPEPIARARNPRRRAWAIAGLMAVCVAAGAGLALISDDGNDGGRTLARLVPSATSSSAQPQGASKQETVPDAGSSGGATAAGAGASGDPAATQPTTATPPATASTAGQSATALNNAGYAMLPSDPQGALPLLSQAVDKFRATGDTSSTDYAYSLYNYGWALRLAGRPADAIPYLQERLKISSYKRDIVEQELKTAQAAAGGQGQGAADAGGATGPTASGARAHGPAKGHGAKGHGPHGHR